MIRQGTNNRRPRGGRHNGQNHGHNRRPNNGVFNKNAVFDSNAPGMKIRGTAQQVQEKYMNFASEAHRSGDHVLAETYYQFAEHYSRLLNNTCNPNDKPTNSGPSEPTGSESSDAQKSDDQPDSSLFEAGQVQPALSETVELVDKPKKKPKIAKAPLPQALFEEGDQPEMGGLNTLPDFLRGSSSDEGDGLFGLTDEKS